MPSESRRTAATSGATVEIRDDGHDPIGEIFVLGGSGGKASARSSDGANVAAPTVLAVSVAVVLVAEGDVNASSQSLLRALVRFGLPRGDADQLQNEIDSGGIIVGVSASDDDRLGIERAFRANAARRVADSMTAS